MNEIEKRLKSIDSQMFLIWFTLWIVLLLIGPCQPEDGIKVQIVQPKAEQQESPK